MLVVCLGASYGVSCTIRCRAFAARDAESEALVVPDQAGGEPLPGSAGTALQVEGEAAAPPLPREVVVLGPQRRGGDGVFRLHHALTEYRHGNGCAGAAQSLNCGVMLRFMEVYAVHLRNVQKRIKLLNGTNWNFFNLLHVGRIDTSSSLSPTFTPALAAGPSSDTLEMKIP